MYSSRYLNKMAQRGVIVIWLVNMLSKEMCKADFLIVWLKLIWHLHSEACQAELQWSKTNGRKSANINEPSEQLSPCFQTDLQFANSHEIASCSTFWDDTCERLVTMSQMQCIWLLGRKQFLRNLCRLRNCVHNTYWRTAI